MPRLQEKYQKEVAPALAQQFGLKNPNGGPQAEEDRGLDGHGRARSEDQAKLEAATKQLALIAGQKPVVTLAKKSISNFKLREGMKVGLKVTLRGARMYEFLDRLITLAIPRVKDFRGLNPNGFDGRGNYNMGLVEQTRLPGDRPGHRDVHPGHEHRDADRRPQRRGGARAAGAAGHALQEGLKGRSSMATNGTNQQGQEDAEVLDADGPALPVVRPAAGGVPQVPHLPHLSAEPGARRQDSRAEEGQLVRRKQADESVRPNCRHADPDPQRRSTPEATGERPGLEGLRGHLPRAEGRRLHRGLQARRGRQAGPPAGVPEVRPDRRGRDHRDQARQQARPAGVHERGRPAPPAGRHGHLDRLDSKGS